MTTLKTKLTKSENSPARSSANQNLFSCRLLRDIAEKAVKEVLCVVTHVAHLFVNFVLCVLSIDPE